MSCLGFWVQVLDDALQDRHPADCKMAVLQDYPATSFHALVDDGFSSVTLALTKGLVLD